MAAPEYLIVPPGPLTILQAVNILISTLGESEVTTVDATSEAVQALSRLNEADLELQSEGWAWNREYNWTLPLDTNGYVQLPAGTLMADLAYAQAQSNGLQTPVVPRGSRLYDPYNHTYVFQAAPTLDLIIRQSWDLLPNQARALITYKAAQRFHARLMADQIIIQVNAQDIRDARTQLEWLEDQQARRNSVNGNASAVSALYGQGGMRRNRAGA